MKLEYQLEGKRMALDSNIYIYQLDNKEEKLKYIYTCDNAYTFSVLERKDFSELFDKIDKNAIFLGIEYKKEEAGYAAFYSNDIKDRIAYLTLICILININVCI